MTRHHQPATGIGKLAAALVAGLFEPAAEKTGHERIARTKHVEHFDLHAWVDGALFQPRRNGPVNHRAALRAELDHQCRGRQFTHLAQGNEQIGGTAGNLEFFFSADDQVEARQDALHMLADLLIGNEPGLAIGLACQPPEHRAVVDIQYAFDVVLLGIVERLTAGLEHLISGEMRAGDQQRLARGNLLLVDVLGAQGHVSAVFPVEHQREGFAVLQPQQHHRRQTLGVTLDGADITALAGQGFDQKSTHVVVADPAQHGRPEPEPGRAKGNIGRRAAQVFGETGNVFQPRPHLLRIKVDAQASEANQIQLTPSGKACLAHGGSCYFYQPAALASCVHAAL